MSEDIETLYGITEHRTYRRSHNLGGDILTGRHPHRRVNTAEIERLLHAGLMRLSPGSSLLNASGGPQIETVMDILSKAGVDIDMQSPGGQRFFQHMSRALARGESLSREGYAGFFRRFLDEVFLPSNGMTRSRSGPLLTP